MILIGNTFPLSLIRRRATIEPRALADLQALVGQGGFLSFWGHDDTRPAATQFLGFDPAPRKDRPALTLTPDLFPTIDGQVFREVWVLSPDYPAGFRPIPGSTVSAEKIIGWQLLHLSFC